jgi:Calcineurin-like phosphoesterase
MNLVLATVLSAWLQYAADGRPHVRARADRTCPVARIDTHDVPMRARAEPTDAFGDVVCDAVVPGGARSIRVGDHVVPAPVHTAPKTVVVFGDTGCRIKGALQQACEDPAAWPFPAIAASIAKLRPDLVVHVGDYYYRESPCLIAACAGPHGDTSASWSADWFAPAAPMFAAAPLVLARGNHEDCGRGGGGWFRYLEGRDAAACSEMTAPWAVSFPGLRLVVFDSAVANDTRADPVQVTAYQHELEAARALAANASGNAWLVIHHPIYTNVTLRTAMARDLRPFDAVLSGHIHLFGTLEVPSLPPLVINGVGGDLLDKDMAVMINLWLGDLHPSSPPVLSANFGFVVYTRTGSGWTVSLRNADGTERTHCNLTRQEIRC